MWRSYWERKQNTGKRGSVCSRIPDNPPYSFFQILTTHLTPHVSEKLKQSIISVFHSASDFCPDSWGAVFENVSSGNGSPPRPHHFVLYFFSLRQLFSEVRRAAGFLRFVRRHLTFRRRVPVFGFRRPGFDVRRRNFRESGCASRLQDWQVHGCL